MVIQHIIDIDFVARDNTPVVHLTQYDDGLPYLVVRTFQNGNPLVLSSNEVTASLRFMKPDGNFVLSPGTVSDTEVCFKIPSAMTVFQGKYPGKVELKDSIGQIICSATIIFDIDMNPVQKDVVESNSDYKDYIDQVLGNIPGFDGYSKKEADAKFAPIDDVQKLEDRKLDKKEADAKFAPINDVQKLEDRKLDKVNSTGGGRVYGVNSRGEQVMRSISGYSHNKATLLYREDNGDCTMQDPIGDYSIANKRYVDTYVGQIALLKTELKAAKIAQYVGGDMSTSIDYVLGVGKIALDPIYGYVRCPVSKFATAANLNKKFDIANIVQTTGNNKNKIMSQNAVSEELSKISNQINTPTIHITNAVAGAEVALQSGKRYFIEGSSTGQSPNVTMSLNNVTAKTNIEVFCKFTNTVILAFEHPNITIETYGTGDLETRIAALNESSQSGIGYLHLHIVGLQDNQCAVLILN